MDHRGGIELAEDGGSYIMPDPIAQMPIAPVTSNPLSITGPTSTASGFTRNKSGHKGIFQKGEKWEVQVRRSGKLHYFGRYLTMESAVEALKCFESGRPVPPAPCKAAPGSSGVKGINKSRNGKWVAYSQPSNEGSGEMTQNALPIAAGSSSINISSSSSNVGSRGKQAKYLGVFTSIEDAQQAIADYQAQGTVRGLTNRQTQQKDNNPQVRTKPRVESVPSSMEQSTSSSSGTGSAQTSAASGVKGITKASHNKWRVTGVRDSDDVNADGNTVKKETNRYYLGTFDDLEDAKKRLDDFHAGNFEPRSLRDNFIAKDIKMVDLKLSGRKYQASGMKKGKKTEAKGMRVLGNYDTLEEAKEAVLASKNNQEIPKPTQKNYGEPRMQHSAIPGSSGAAPGALAIPGNIHGDGGDDTEDDIGEKRGRASTSGILGVTKRKDDWMARIVDDCGVRHYLGTFKTKDAAAEAIMAHRNGAPLAKKARGRPALPKNQKQGNGLTETTYMPNSMSSIGSTVSVPMHPLPVSAVMPAAVHAAPRVTGRTRPVGQQQL